MPTVESLNAFDISVTDDPSQTIRFDQGQVYLSGKLLAPQDQKKLLTEYENAYRAIRRRNYGWRFLSACHQYFNGQLREIQAIETDLAKLRYLFSHALEKPESKTAEALRLVLTLSCAKAMGVKSAPAKTPRSARTALTESGVGDAPSKPGQFALAAPSQIELAHKVVDSKAMLRSDTHHRYLRWVDEAFLPIWRMPSVRKVASLQYDPRSLRYYLLFNDDCNAAIIKS